jgi:hypothetical protein
MGNTKLVSHALGQGNMIIDMEGSQNQLQAFILRVCPAAYILSVNVLFYELDMLAKTHGHGLRWIFDFNNMLVRARMMQSKYIVESGITFATRSLNNIEVFLAALGGEESI